MYGSIINQYVDSNTVPEVGMGATVCGWTDRHAATITNVVRYKSGERRGEIREVHVTYDIATRVDTNGQSESQRYTFETDPDGFEVEFTRRADGRYVLKGATSGRRLVIGHRDHYYDYSF